METLLQCLNASIQERYFDFEIWYILKTFPNFQGETTHYQLLEAPLKNNLLPKCLKPIVEALLAGAKYVRVWISNTCTVISRFEENAMFSSVLNPSLCLYIAMSPSLLWLFQGHVACWNVTQQGLIVKTHSTCSSLPDAKNIYYNYI